MENFIEKQRVDEYLTQLRQGDSSALGRLYELTSKRLYSLCYTYTRNHHDSEDALSETYLAVVKGIDGYRGEKGYNWLYTIAKHICLNMMRGRQREMSVDFDDEETVNTLGLEDAEGVHAKDESGITALACEILNEKEFRIVVLHAVNEMRFKEIARLIGGLESTVRWQYNNAIKKVKNAYEGRKGV